MTRQSPRMTKHYWISVPRIGSPCARLIYAGSSAAFWRNRSQKRSAPGGTIKRIGRSIARTSTESPTSIG